MILCIIKTKNIKYKFVILNYYVLSSIYIFIINMIKYK